MTSRAGQAGVSAGEREEIVLEIGPRPARGRMASLAVGRPAAGDVVGGRRAGKIALMAELALPRSAAELADGGLEVTALARSDGVRGDQMEARSGVIGDRARRPPVCLLVAFFAIQSQRGGVRVRVTSAAPAGEVHLDRSAVVVTAKARRVSVCALEAIAGRSRMVEREIGPHEVPSLRHVAEPAVPRKRLVRHEGPPLPVPALPWDFGAAVDNEYHACRDEQAREKCLLSLGAYHFPAACSFVLMAVPYEVAVLHGFSREHRGPAFWRAVNKMRAL